MGAARTAVVVVVFVVAIFIFVAADVGIEIVVFRAGAGAFFVARVVARAQAREKRVREDETERTLP